MSKSYNMPSQFFAGDTLEFYVNSAEYPAPAYTLNYALVNSSGQITITGTADGTDHKISVASATTADYTAGEYQWHAYFTKSGERRHYASGHVEIITDYTAETGGFDARTFTKKVLDALESAIQNTASAEQLILISQSCESLNVQYKPDLIKTYRQWKELYNQEVKAGKIADGQGVKSGIYVRFK